MESYYKEFPEEIAGWLWSEKLDGVKAEWNGYRLLTKNGRPINPPAHITASLPEGIAIHGELFAGYGTFTHVAAAVRKGKTGNWAAIEFIAFDFPGKSLAKTEKLCTLYGLKSVKFNLIAGDIDATLSSIADAGGEGVVFRSPNGRQFLKYKPYRDAEATVIGYVTGKRSVSCLTDEGITFNLATRNRPIVRGDRVTYSYMTTYASGKPRQPIFVEVRNYD